MGFASFIAKKVYFSPTNRFAGIIIKIAIGSVAFCTFVMILASAMINGFQKEVSEKIFGFWGHIHIMHYDSNNTYETTPISIKQPFYPSIDTLGQIEYQEPLSFLGNMTSYMTKRKTYGGVFHIQPFIYKTGILKTKNLFDGTVLKGVDPTFKWSFLEDYIIEGDSITILDSVKSNGILISKITADRLALKVGDKVRSHFIEGELQLAKQFVVSGIYKTGLNEYDKRFALVDMRHLQKLNKWSSDQVSGFEVLTDDVRDIEPFEDFINYNETGYDLYARSIRKVDENLFSWLELQDLNKNVILLLMLIVSMINVATALVILILERTQMIGVLKSLGASNWKIQKIFLNYSFLIITTGLIIGNFLGLGFSFLQKITKIIPMPKDSYYIEYVPIQVNWTEVIGINTAMVILILVVLVLPTFLVLSITPIKALRFR